MNSQDYWKQRALEAKNNFNNILDKDKALQDLYEDSLRMIQTELLQLYYKISSNTASITESNNHDRLNNMMNEIDRILENLENKQRGYIDKQVKKAYKAGGSINNNFVMPNRKVMQQILREPWIGANYSERVWDNRNILEQSLNITLRMGIIKGEQVATIAKKIEKETNGSLSRAITLVRTETMHYFNEGAKEGYRQAGVEEVEWFTAEDERTCLECGNMHGERFSMDKAPLCPTHPRCRCVYVPIIHEKMINEAEEIRKFFNSKEELEKRGIEINIEDFISFDRQIFIRNAEKLIEMLNKYPRAQEWINKGNKLIFTSGFIKGEFGCTLNNTSYKKQQIILSNKYFQSKDSITTEIKSNGFMPALEKNFDIYSLTHEFGHYIQNILLGEYYKQNPKIYNDMLKKIKAISKDCEKIDMVNSFDFAFTDKMKNDILKIAEKLDEKFKFEENISYYGAGNSKDFFAECFANSECGKINILGMALLEYLKKVF